MKRLILAMTGILLFNPFGVASQPTDHGASLSLGTIAISGHKLKVIKLGTVEPGKESAFQVDCAEDAPRSLAALNAYLWLEDDSGAQISAPGKGIVEGSALHFHVTPKAGSTPKRVVVRVRDSGKDERGTLPLDGHGHEHASTPHEGVVASFKDSAGEGGFLELKLHDDKGDLELWLGRDNKLATPFDLPIGSEISVTFIDLNSRVVTLKPRNQDKNEDESGTPNNRNGATNYFIYPQTADQDSSWLKGAQFQSIVQVSFNQNGKVVTSEEFMLVPHTHADGGHH